MPPSDISGTQDEGQCPTWDREAHALGLERPSLASSHIPDRGRLFALEEA